jgi:hypothetical protein
MTTRRVLHAAILLLGLSSFAGGALSSPSLNWPGKSASIGGAIAARIIAVKCSGPLTPAEIAELDAYIDERQTAFMMSSEANRRLSEIVFPQLARDYNKTFSKREACDFAARDMARDMLERVRAAQAELKKHAEVKQ